MYAVIESGGKQYRVELGSQIQVDRLDVQPGDSVTLDRVLLVADGDDTAIGRPVVGGASVVAHVVAQDRGDKIVVFKYKPKARRRVKKGFRAELTTLRISDIAFDGRSAARDAEASEAEKAKAAKTAEKAAAEKAAADRELAAKLAAASEPAAEDAEEGTPRKRRASAEKGDKSGTTGRATRTRKATAAAADEAPVTEPETPGPDSAAETAATEVSAETPATEAPGEADAPEAAAEPATEAATAAPEAAEAGATEAADDAPASPEEAPADPDDTRKDE